MTQKRRNQKEAHQKGTQKNLDSRLKRQKTTEVNMLEKLKHKEEEPNLMPKSKKGGPGRPSTKPKYEFTEDDTEVIKEGMRKYGNSYSNIAKEYYNKTEPPVTATDIKNYVNSHEELKMNAAKNQKIKAIFGQFQQSSIELQLQPQPQPQNTSLIPFRNQNNLNINFIINNLKVPSAPWKDSTTIWRNYRSLD